MTVRIANGYLLTPAPWLRAREPAVSEPIRAVVIATAAPRTELVVLADSDAAPQDAAREASRASVQLLPPPAGSSPHTARAAQAYAAASEPLRAWAVGCCLHVQA